MSSKAATRAREPSLETPYLAGRREWNERYGDYIAQARNWRLTAVFALIIAMVSSAGLVHVASQSQIVPYIVRVDKLGGSAVVGRADQAFAPDNPLIVASLARWVQNIRSIYADASAQRTILKEGYALINEKSEAYVRLNDYMRQNDPFQRAQTETATVEVETVLPLSPNSWRIEWREETRARDGSKPSTKEWQATVSTVINPPRDEQTLRLNPLGIYINSFNWSPRL